MADDPVVVVGVNAHLARSFLTPTIVTVCPIEEAREVAGKD